MKSCETSYLIPIEVKYFSEKHGEGEEDQLARYYFALGSKEERKTFYEEKISQFEGELVALIYLTQFDASQEIENSIHEMQRRGIRNPQEKIFPLYWSDASRVIKEKTENETRYPEKLIYQDIWKLLSLRNLIPFEGFSTPSSELTYDALTMVPLFLKIKDKQIQIFFGFGNFPGDLDDKFLQCRPIFFKATFSF